MKKFLFFALALLLSAGVFAQTEKRKCGTMEYLAAQIAENPGLESQMQLYETQLQEWIKNNQEYINSSKTVITVPVVVHVIYYTAAENLSDARIQEQINQTNIDYAGLNPHSTEAFSSSLKVNTELQFCLAQRKPDGTATNGIERRLISSDIAFTTNNNVKHYSTNGLDAWDPTKYMNVWVCNLSGLCGYAQFPTSGVNSTYGVVCNYQYFGLTGAVAPYNLGGTLSHEIGHCFNLYHVWGDDGTACTGTDYCADIPNQAGPTYGDHSGVLTDACSATSPGIMYTNFMDYSDDIDYANFTPNQKARIQALFVSGGLLYSLVSSNGCTPPSTTCSAPTGMNTTSITQTGATLGWSASVSATGYNVQYRKTGTTTWTSSSTTSTSLAITGLTANTSYEWQVNAICPAGVTAWTASTTFTTLAAGCTDAWEANNTLATAKTIAVATNINGLITPSTDLDWFKFSNTSSKKKIKVELTNLPADYDVALYKSNGTQLAVSQNGGTTSEKIVYNNGSVATYYVKVYGYGGATSATVCYNLKVSLSATNWSKREDGTGTSLEEGNTAMLMSIYPNPASGTTNLDFNADRDGKLVVRLFDMTGRKMADQQYMVAKGMNTYQLDLSGLPKGLYIIDVQNGTDRIVDKLMVN